MSIVNPHFAQAQFVSLSSSVSQEPYFVPTCKCVKMLNKMLGLFIHLPPSLEDFSDAQLLVLIHSGYLYDCSHALNNVLGGEEDSQRVTLLTK